MSEGPWSDNAKPQPIYRLLRLVGLVLVATGLWQLIQGFLAAQAPGVIPPAASWAVPAILGGIPIGVALLVLASLRLNRPNN